MSKFRDGFKQARAAAEDIGGVLFTILGLASFIALMANSKGRSTGNSTREAGWNMAKRYGSVAKAEAIFALASVLFLEMVAWPGTILLGMWRHTVAWNHIHSSVYVANHYGQLTSSALFTEWIFSAMVWMFVTFLVVKLVQKMTLIRLAAVSGFTGLTVGFLSGLKFKDGDKDFSKLEVLRTAIGSGNQAMLAAASVVFRKGQNENWWSTACFLLIIIVPYFLGPVHPLFFMIPSALAVCGIWEIQTSNGNNTDIAGNSVLEENPDGTPRKYPTWDAKQAKVVDGYKPVVAGFQQLALGLLAGLIIIGAVVSYLGFTGTFVGIRHGERVATITTSEMRKWRRHHDSASVDTTAIRDSIAAVAGERVGLGQALLPGDLVVSAHYATSDALPTAETSGFLIWIQNAWNAFWWAIRSLGIFKLIIALGLAVFGAYRTSEWARGVMWVIAVLFGAAISGSWWWAALIASAILTTIVFRVLSPAGNQATVSAPASTH